MFLVVNLKCFKESYANFKFPEQIIYIFIIFKYLNKFI